MNRVVHFDILTEKPEKLMEFYKKIFGWKFEKYSGPMDYWMIKTGEGPGIDGGMGLKNPESISANTISVQNLDKKIKLITENGGTIISQKNPIPGIGWFAVFKDIDGNVFGLMQEDINANYSR
jgi:predicted enzyme related to lactoylglutathione lyase